ncbi:MAG: glycosyl hydrolase [Flavobacteriaceae bacterium]|nr:glycosyl hydrolase [Flavobacteriaceae bacterium]
MKKIILIFLFGGILFSQPQPTESSIIEKIDKEHFNNQNKSRVKNLPFESIGPAIMSGRVVALSVNPEQSTEFYVAYASGGVWHTIDNGISFNAIMDNAPTQNIGEISMHWPTRTLWVGTGENNSSRSSYSGIGVLKTSDNGKTWTKHGLSGTHHIGKIIIDEDNPNHIIVGSTGPLYSLSNQRGIFVTNDGGLNWRQTLFINNHTGIIDIAQNPNNLSNLYAASWEKDRKAWNFKGSGNSSGIYKSVDFGETWELITTEESGFPSGEGVGRIGLAVYNDNILYAIHDNQFRRDKKNETKEELTKNDFKNISKTKFLELENKTLNEFLKTNGFQDKYKAENVKKMVENDIIKPIDLAIYLEDANTQLFDTPVIGAEVYKSEDGGKTWNKTHDEYLDGIYYSYGYYFGHIHVAPFNSNKIYIYGVPLLTSDDAGTTFYSINKNNVHADHHALWINPNKPGHLINGNDGGINITYDDGKNWMKNNSTNVGQFYSINVDYEKPYNVYGGLQDNGVWKGAHNQKEDSRWHSTGRNPWNTILGGDGMQIQIDNRNSNIVYTGFQFGNYFRLDLSPDRKTSNNYNNPIKPIHELGEAPYRFNWQTPILLSSHNQDIIYLGSNKLHQSFNRGDTWDSISEDLTYGGKKGNVPYGTITTISESPFKFGMIYTGSDDGKIALTKNGGSNWEVISEKLPENMWVSRVIASEHKKSRVYVTLNGYRWDDFSPYVYLSEDYGKSWISISSNLPNSPINVIREDPDNQNILYLGNDIGSYISFDKGKKWEAFKSGLTTAAVHDIVIQSNAKDILIGTHGRSIFRADIQHIQSLTKSLINKTIHVYDLKTIKFSENWGSKRNVWSKYYTPKAQWSFWTKESGTSKISLISSKGKVLYHKEVFLDTGYNIIDYNLIVDHDGTKKDIKKFKNEKLHYGEDGFYYLGKGKYTLKIEKNGKEISTNWEIN